MVLPVGTGHEFVEESSENPITDALLRKMKGTAMTEASELNIEAITVLVDGLTRLVRYLAPDMEARLILEQLRIECGRAFDARNSHEDVWPLLENKFQSVFGYLDEAQ